MMSKTHTNGVALNVGWVEHNNLEGLQYALNLLLMYMIPITYNHVIIFIQVMIWIVTDYHIYGHYTMVCDCFKPQGAAYKHVRTVLEKHAPDDQW
jgi:hypothetical protein